MQNKDKQNSGQEWLYNLKPGDKVIVNYGNQGYYKVGQVKSVKMKKKKDGSGGNSSNDDNNCDIIIGVGSCTDINNPIDLFINGKRKMGRYSNNEILYEYSDYNYQELIGIPNVVRVLNDFRFEGLISKEDGKRLLLEIYSRLRKEGWL